MFKTDKSAEAESRLVVAEAGRALGGGGEGTVIVPVRSNSSEPEQTGV